MGERLSRKKVTLHCAAKGIAELHDRPIPASRRTIRGDPPKLAYHRGKLSPLHSLAITVCEPATPSGRRSAAMPTKYKRVNKPLSCTCQQGTWTHAAGAECRRLKIKCDLRFPCSHCSKRGLAKICPDAELSQGSRRM